MNDEQFGKMVRVLAAHGFAVIPMAGAQSLLAPGKPATAAAPKSATTADGRKAYTCGTCGQTGHNVRACPTTTAAAPAPAAAPKARAAAPAVQAPAPSVGLDDLSFDLSDLGGAPAAAPPVQRKAAAPAPKATPAPKAAAPAPAPEPQAEAADEDVSSFLDDLDDLLPG